MKQVTLILRRAAALGLCLIISAGFAGCGDQTSSDSEENIPMDQLEYGATLRENTAYAISAEYDKRYLEEEEVQVLVAYYDAVQKKDSTQFSSCIVDFYLDYLLNNAYGNLLDSSAYVAAQYDAFEDMAGDAFTFSQIKVTNCKFQNSPTSGVDYLIDMFDELNGAGYCDEHLKSAKTLTVQVTAETAETSTASQDMTVYVVDIDGTYYVCP